VIGFSGRIDLFNQRVLGRNEYMDFAVVKQFALCPCERMESAKEDA
jgi:hypothetical protein